jgi:putative peptide zinc metalloprotease protein
MNKDITAISKVDCSHLSIQEDIDDEFTIGDPHTGEFLRVPKVAVDVIEMLDGRNSIGEVIAAVSTKYNEDVDVIDFVMTLLDCKMVFSIDGQVLHSTINREPLTILRRLGSFFFSKVLISLYVVAFIAVISFFAANPTLFPKFKDLFIYETVGLSTLNIVIVAWILTLIHEVGHLLAASKENISTRIRLNLRMIWLVAETDMTGLWARPKNNRYVPFLAGMMWDVVIILACLIIQQTTNHPLIIGYSKLIVFLVLFAFLFQFIIFLRTDLYFVVSNWKNTSALHQNSLMYLSKTILKKDLPDWEHLPEYEKKNAVWFGFLYGIGGIIAISLFLYFQVPPVLYGVSLVYKSLTLYSIDSYYFWDSAIVLFVFILQGIAWLFGLRTSLILRKERKSTVEA